MPCFGRQTCQVPKTSLKQTLAVNLQWLMDSMPELGSQAKVGAKAKIDQKTVSRILNATNATTLDKLEALAGALQVEPWQLIAPRLGADFYFIDSERRVVAIEVKGGPPPSGDQTSRYFQPPPLPADAAAVASRESTPRRTSTRSAAKPKGPAKAGR